MPEDFTQLNKQAHRFLLKTAKAHKKGKTLHQLLKSAGAIEMPTRPRGSLIFVLARAIVGQQVAAKVAAVFWQRILEQAETKNNFADFLAPHNERKIRGCGISNNKTRFLIGLGEANRAGEVSARRVKAMPHDERIVYLSRLDGIGVWTADMVGIFYCRDKDIWPQGDLAVRRTFANLVKIDENKGQELAAHFRPFRTFLAFHMWREKNNPLIKNS